MDRRNIPPRTSSGELNSGRRPESVPPLTAEESERLWRKLKDIGDDQKTLLTELERARAETRAQFADHNTRLRAVEDAQREAEIAYLEFAKANKKLDALLERDERQEARLLSLEAKKQASDAGSAAGTESGYDAGKKVAQKSARYVAVAVIGWEIFMALWPKIKEMLLQ